MTNRSLLNLCYAEATLDLMLMLDVCLRETSRITKEATKKGEHLLREVSPEA